MKLLIEKPEKPAALLKCSNTRLHQPTLKCSDHTGQLLASFAGVYQFLSLFQHRSLTKCFWKFWKILVRKFSVRTSDCELFVKYSGYLRDGIYRKSCEFEWNFETKESRKRSLEVSFLSRRLRCTRSTLLQFRTSVYRTLRTWNSVHAGSCWLMIISWALSANNAFQNAYRGWCVPR